MMIRLASFAVAVLVALAVLASSAADALGATCHEDQRCWRWSTMGNLDRGVTTTSGTLRVVSPCTFAYLDMRGRIDWTRTERLRGDGFARRHGCNPRLYAA